MSDNNLNSCCCQPLPKREAPCCPGAGRKPGWVDGAVDSAGRKVPRVKSRLELSDHLGNWKVRWHMGRGSHRVEPGLYAVGDPDKDSPVLVTANYKMSFDRLRTCLAGRNAWLLPVDTRGINVWCAAGKGTFGAAEVARQVVESGLKDVVSHRTLVLPQLSAPGVSAAEVKRETGFRVVFGPVRAADLPAFLDGGMKADQRMRRVEFALLERLGLIPVETVEAMKFALPLALLFGILAGLGPGFYSLGRLVAQGPVFAAATLLSVVAAAALTPALLPWLPGRAFSLKGLWIGLLSALVALCADASGLADLGGFLGVAGWLFAIPAISSFVAMNFTGATTFTSQSGVLREMKSALPLQMASSVLGLGLILAGRFF